MDIKRNIKRSIKSFTILILIFSLLGTAFVYTPAAALEQGISVYLDGVRLSFEVPPMIINGRTMVPLRAIFEAMGAEVTWDQEQQLAYASTEDTSVALYIGSLNPSVNNSVEVLDVPAVIMNNRTLAPLRFIGEAFGGTVTWDAATKTVNIYTDPSFNHEFPKKNLDYFITSADLSLVEEASPSRTYVRPGVTLNLRVKINKNGEDIGGGGKVIVTFNGEQIDVLPFYIEPAANYVTFYKDYQIPLYSPNLGSSAVLKAEIVGDALVNDTNKGNNTVQVPVTIQSPTRLENINVPDSTIVSIKAKSEFGIGLAKSGSYLALTATIQGSGQRTIVGYYINGVLIDERALTPPKSGEPYSVTHNYHVPWENNGLLRYSVKLDNGEEMYMPVATVPFEYGVVPNSITWNKETSVKNYIPGQSIAMAVKIIRDNKNSFTDNFGALRAYFLINGELSPALRVEPTSGSSPFMSEVHYTYKVPLGQTSPLTVQVFTDPGGLLKEEREDNNSASVSIPQNISGNSGNNLSISSTGIRTAPTRAVPGEKIELIATIKNNSSVYPSNGINIRYKINGETVYTTSTVRPAYYFDPGQTYTTYTTWTVPSDMKGDLTYTVEIDPDNRLAGDNKADNTATRIIPMTKPELSIEANSLRTAGSLLSGAAGRLKARIYNTGPVCAEETVTAFYIGQAEAGRITVDMPAYSALDVSVPFTVPSLPSVMNNTPLSAASGYLTSPADFQSISYSVKIDPSNAINESNENNNAAGPKALQVRVPSSKGKVYVEALDLNYDPVMGALMTLKTGTSTISATSAKNGYCTFSAVPFGPYEVTVTKKGYLPGKTQDEEVIASYVSDRITVFMDDRSIMTGTVTSSQGQSLEGVKVLNTTAWESSYTGSNGKYTLRLQPGTFSIKFLMRGYKPVSEFITVGDAAEITRNPVMEPTTKCWAYGQVIDRNEVPVANLRIDAINGYTKKVIATTYSSGAGKYNIEVPLSEDGTWIGLTATYDGAVKLTPCWVYYGDDFLYDISFVPTPPIVNEQSGTDGKVAPYVVCASMPGTFFNPDYEVEAIYGMFDMSMFTTIEDGYMTYLDVDTTGQPWVSATVSSSWDPAELLGYDELVPGYDILSAILPLSIPLAINMCSTNHTMVWVKKVSVISDDNEVYSRYPDAVNDYSCAPGVGVNWDNCRVKYYLKVDPDNGVVNPAAGYNLDRVLVVWNPKDKKFTKIGNYQVIGWDEDTAREIYMDE